MEEIETHCCFSSLSGRVVCHTDPSKLTYHGFQIDPINDCTIGHLKSTKIVDGLKGLVDLGRE